MVRKLVLAMAAAGALSSTTAQALGLGDITLRSALNQPLSAEIELIELKGLDQNEILPNLASREDFTLAGVERDFFLNDLKFSTVLRENGTAYLQVSTRKPVREPYLNFLVEIHWPNGRLLREYTLLLDPPTFTEEVPAPVAPPAAEKVEPVAPSRPAASVAPRPTAKPVMPAPAQPRVESADVGGGTYTTNSNDTLWEIAATNRPSRSVSVQQTMMAIQQMNPDAFIKQNINLLKRGQVLRLPTLEQTQQLTQRQAVSEVAVQNQQWRDTRDLGAPQLDAARREAVESEGAVATQDGKLTLASASETGTTTSGSDNGSMAAADVDALQNELAINQEKLEKVLRESGEVSSQLTELESQIETLQRLLSLKDEQLAALQAQLAAKGEVPAEIDYNYEEEKPATEAPVAEVAVPDAGVDATQQPAMDEAQPESVATPEPVVKPEPKPEVVKPKPVKPAPAPEMAEPSLVDEILQNPIYLAAGGGALVLLLALLLLARRRSASDESKPESEAPETLGAEESVAEFEAEDALDEAAEEEIDDALSLDGDDDLQETTTAQTGDAIGEADIYIAYGRFNQAVDLLSNAIAQEPGRADLRVKLLEAYAEMKDADSFVKQENELSALGDSIAMQEAESLKAKFPAGALDAVSADSNMSELDVDDLDEALTLDDMDTADAAVEFSLDDLELDLPLGDDADGVAEAEPVTPSVEADDAGDDDFMSLAGDADASDALEFDLDGGDLGDSLDSDDHGAVEESLGSDLDVELDALDEVDGAEFKLDDDLSLDADAGDEFELDDLELPLESATGDDLDLSLDTELGDSELEGFGLDLEESAGDELELDLDDEFDLSLGDEEASGEEVELDVSGGDTLEEPVEEGLPDIEFDLGGDDVEASQEDVQAEEPAVEAAILDEPDFEAKTDELDDIEFDLSDVSLETDELDSLQDLSDEQASEADSDELSEFDLDLDEVEEPVEVPVDEEIGSAAVEIDDAELNLGEEFEIEDLTAEAASEPAADVQVEEDGEFDQLAQDLAAGSDMAALDAATESLASEFDGEDEDSMEEEFDFLAGTNETATKLDLARAYVDMGDVEGARDILEEVLKEGDEAQLKEAQELLDKI
ncbi:FimV/HubP family polar landmark protein [Aestuariirhabdus sp. LZHN29]|uniref:FimV/HubP family polar landmark protein n=1 Tax=Aestuariirhabdus sp. LZHN29 TaxID=3417462 RepID=UPI003CF5B670